MNAILNLQPEAADTLTVLTHSTRSLRMAKTWRADGTIKGYDQAGSFTVRSVPVRSIAHFARLLADDWAGDPYSCLIRGALREEHMGTRVVRRDSAHFKPVPLHLLALDVDSYEPVVADLSDPAGCVEEFVQCELPSEFQGASYVYHLSSSFGHPSAAGRLKVHLFFWLARPQYGTVLKAWIKQRGLPVDASMTRDVQPIYVANPVFEDGVVDPWAGRRGGLVRGTRESVDLDLDGVDVSGVVEGLRDKFALADPREKPGAIGLFCRTFDMQQVLERWLSDVFVPVNGRRLTYLKGSGAPEGAWITDDDEYIGNQHDSCPFEGRLANKWDLVRVFKFGHLDEGLDAFARLNVAALPSQAAMLAMVQGLDEIKREMRSGVEKWRSEIAECAVADDLLSSVAAGIAADRDLDRVMREQLAQDLQARVRVLGGGRIPIAMVRGLVAPVRTEGVQRREPPDWASDLYLFRTGRVIKRLRDRATFDITGFNAEFAGEVEVGDGETAFSVCEQEGWFTMVAGERYRPDMPAYFMDEDGQAYLNSYNPASVPVAQDMGAVAQSCVDAFKAHMLLLMSGRDELANFFQKWMAWQVQRAGQKVLWVPLLKGCEGDGKTLIRNILGAALGEVNVGEVSCKALHSDFNGFVEGKCVRVLEEIRASGRNRHDVLDSLKAPITNRRITVHRKGKDEYDTLNVTNYLAFTNHSDALPLAKGDRRWLIVFSPYLHRDELQQDVGMDLVDYFEPMHRLYREFGPHIRHWLLGVDLTGFDPFKTAMTTDEKSDMQELGVSDDEAIIREIVEGLDVVQSKWVNQMYSKHPDATRLSRQIMPKILERLGFRIWHKQFKLKYENGEDKNVTVYGKNRTAPGRDEVVAALTESGQTKNIAIF